MPKLANGRRGTLSDPHVSVQSLTAQAPNRFPTTESDCEVALNDSRPAEYYRIVHRDRVIVTANRCTLSEQVCGCDRETTRI